MSAIVENDAPEPLLPAGEPLISGQERLWAPWRMRYVADGTREDGCIFCNRLAAGDDVRTLILYRGERAFAIMNLFPYNTGHLMIVPNVHVSTPENVDLETVAEMAALRTPILRALRRALSCQGFNLGLNIGDVAGAGVSDHLHEHVVPRWVGDANFMPILASTMVMPELIPVTYAKLRAEIAREFGGGKSVTLVVLFQEGCSVLVNAAGDLPQVTASDEEPLWRAALRFARENDLGEVELVGSAAVTLAGSGPAPLVLLATVLEKSGKEDGFRLMPVEEVLVGPDGQVVQGALRNLRAVPAGSD
jgi:ATP adenylyltransferase